MIDLIGKSIGGYQLLELIGEDEHTLHVKAFQPGEDLYVIFTMLKPHAAKDSLFVQQFLNSAEIAAQMAHKNILPIYDHGQQDHVVFRVSPLIETGTVRDNRGRFYNLHNTSTLISQITEGLAYIYSQGHIHGNLKSSNIFLNPELHPMMAGFGKSQPAGFAENPYLSPEQIQGSVVDQRTDVYALGVLLYEVLTGATPPVGIIVKPSTKRRDLPQAVDRVVLKAMAQNPDQRYQTPEEFNNALYKAVMGHATAQPTTVPGMSQSVTVQQTKGTNWAAIVLGIILIAVLIGGAVLIIPRLFREEGVIIVPTGAPVVQPTVPPVEQPPIEEPAPPPNDGSNRPDFQLPEGLPDFCYSIVGAAGIAVSGIVIAANKHRRNSHCDD